MTTKRIYVVVRYDPAPSNPSVLEYTEISWTFEDREDAAAYVKDTQKSYYNGFYEIISIPFLPKQERTGKNRAKEYPWDF